MEIATTRPIQDHGTPSQRPSTARSLWVAG